MADPPLSFRDARQSDVPALARLYVRVYALPPWHETHEVEATEAWMWPHMRPALVHTLVSVDCATGNVVGFVCVSQYSREQLRACLDATAVQPPDGWPEIPGRLAYVWELVVDPNYQRRGIGTRLMGLALERLRRDGADRVLLHTSDRSAAAVAVYRKLGFERLPLREREDPMRGLWLLTLDPDHPYSDVTDPPTSAPLAWVWACSWRALNPDVDEADVARAFEALAALYAAPERRYHTLVHVRECLIEVYWEWRTGHAMQSSDLITLALFFHDCIYDPRRSDNEVRSADHAAGVMRTLGLAEHDVQTVHRLIMRTHHGPGANGDTAVDPDAPLIGDVDLAILGRPAIDFDRYDAAIRSEYAHVPDAAYRAGRAAVLRSFLERPRIYTTEPLFRRYEERARANLARALARLS